MADLKEIAEKRSTLLWFDPSKIEEKPGLNARDMESAETREHVEELCAGIIERGFLTSRPLQIFQDDDGVWVAAGHCRLRAVKLAISRGVEIVSVPCLIEPKGTNDLARQLDQIADNNGGLELSAIEAGAAIKKAISTGWSIQKIAAHVGKSPSWVSETLKFQAAPVEVHEAVKAGEISATLAAKTVRERGNDEAVTVIKEGVQKAKASGKKKATARHIAPAPRKTIPTGKNDAELTFKGGSIGISIQFGEHSAITLPKSAWRDAANKILTTIETM